MSLRLSKFLISYAHDKFYESSETNNFTKVGDLIGSA